MMKVWEVAVDCKGDVDYCLEEGVAPEEQEQQVLQTDIDGMTFVATVLATSSRNARHLAQARWMALMAVC